MTNKNPFILFFVTALFLVPQMSWGKLLIHPTRVNFSTDERSQFLTVANTSDEVSTYQLMWKENIALPDGGYREMEEAEKGQYPLASQFIRFSPRQVTLRPGERQTVKLLLRRARNLEQGEYRSHLMFKAIPAANKDKKEANRPTMSINMVLNFAIPVSLRVGNYDVQVRASEPVIQFDKAQNSGYVYLTLERAGVHSSYGDMSAFWTPKGGEEILLAKSAGHSLWTEENKYRHKLAWAAKDFTPQDGVLRIYYEGIKQFKDIDYINQSFPFKRSDIKPLPKPPAPKR